MFGHDGGIGVYWEIMDVAEKGGMRIGDSVGDRVGEISSGDVRRDGR